MSKITIELTNDDKIVVTYYSNDVIYPICDIDNNNFHISETTNIYFKQVSTEICRRGCISLQLS